MKIIIITLSFSIITNCLNNKKNLNTENIKTTNLIQRTNEHIYKPDKKPTDSTLKINIDCQNHIFVNEREVTIKELKEIVFEYELENTSKSIFHLYSEKQTKVHIVIEVYNSIIIEINNLRDKLAKERFGINYHKLDRQQLTEVNQTYPQIIDIRNKKLRTFMENN